ncbi:MAG: hypothetical protein JNM07_15795, partial [Phycisphaerae bacterium]|nr:hypothetical protein [Phycisphaerae bacterium]
MLDQPSPRLGVTPLRARQRDVVVGTPIANRMRAELEGVVGLFVNTLALRSQFGAATSFAEAVSKLRTTAMSAYAHQYLPFEQVVEMLRVPRDPSRNPVFQAMFALQN